MLLALLLQAAPAPAPAWVRPPLPLADPALLETSALALSPAHPGVLWSLNDSDNPPVLFATDTAGRALGQVALPAARNDDWEALAFGPCPAAARGAAAPACLYVGDIGDNSRVRPFVRLYRVREPAPGRDTVAGVLDSLRITYADGPRDAESLAVAADGTVWIVSKERVRDPRLYRIPAAAWRRGRAVAQFVTTLPIPSASGVEHWTTDAAWGADGAMMVRTYGALWRVPFAHGRPEAAATRVVCSLAGLGGQGEGLAWLGGDLYALSSEKVFTFPASVALARCAG